MEDFKIGDYIRTDTGYIGKLERIEYGTFEQPAYHINNRKFKKINNGFPIFKCRIKKHNSNIINLIKENDAIKFWYKKERICNVYKTSNGNLCVWNGFEDVPIKHIHIKSIITKEQFENEEYRLEE